MDGAGAAKMMFSFFWGGGGTNGEGPEGAKNGEDVRCVCFFVSRTGDLVILLAAFPHCGKGRAVD